jgi:surfeit locus 1 family protein
LSAAVARRPYQGIGFWAFIVLMLALTGLFLVLGVWQVQRLAWKEGLIAEVDARLTAAPYVLPPPDHWEFVHLDDLAYHPITVTGTYVPDKTVLVFTSLSDDAKGKYKGPGYWVMVPLDAGGGIAFINRGFVPQANAPAFANGGPLPQGPQTITGIGIAPEEAGAFTPGPDKTGRIEWVRDPARLASLAGVSGTVLGMTIDAPATALGALPQGGETTVDFPNNHLGYALTWFGFAILTPCLLAFWIWRQLRPNAPGA